MVFRHKIASIILDYYFWVFILSTIGYLITGKQYIISVLFPVTLYYLAINGKYKAIGIFDILIFLIFMIMIMSWFYNDYQNKESLIFRCIIGECSFISAYFIGRRFDNRSNIIDYAMVPLLLCSIIGIWWFFMPPGSWYTANYDEALASGGGYGILDQLRLRSIFSSPYVMSYMTALTFIFIINRNRIEGKEVMYLCIFTIVLILCMMRAPILSVILSLLIVFIKRVLMGEIKAKKLFGGSILLGVIIIIIGSFLLEYVDVERLDYLNDKLLSVTEGSSDFTEERLSLWDKQNYQYDIIGDGAGRHAIYADDYNIGTSIRDSEYVRILVELGYSGLTMYIILLACAIIKCVRHFRLLTLDLCIILFYAITMIGANSLTTQDKHGIIFWLTMGHIASYRSKRKEKSLLVNQTKK